MSPKTTPRAPSESAPVVEGVPGLLDVSGVLDDMDGEGMLSVMVSHEDTRRGKKTTVRQSRTVVNHSINAACGRLRRSLAGRAPETEDDGEVRATRAAITVDISTTGA